MMTRHFSCIALLLISAATVAASSSEECVYTLYVKTGDLAKAGTDSKISVTLSGSSGKSVRISNLENWGVMDRKHDYFETGNLDIFSGRARCISPPICKLNLTSDGRGVYPGWFVEYVELTFTGPHEPCSQTIFFVNQWLSAPYELSVVVDQCKYGIAQAQTGEGRKRPFSVRTAMNSASK